MKNLNITFFKFFYSFGILNRESRQIYAISDIKLTTVGFFLLYILAYFLYLILRLEFIGYRCIKQSTSRAR